MVGGDSLHLHVCTIDQGTVRDRFIVLPAIGQVLRKQSTAQIVVIVLKHEHSVGRVLQFLIVFLLWGMNNQRPNKSIRGLETFMRMVPASVLMSKATLDLFLAAVSEFQDV
jgi:hypothetical protein